MATTGPFDECANIQQKKGALLVVVHMFVAVVNVLAKDEDMPGEGKAV